MISKSIALILRLAQLFCAATVMALVGHMLSSSYYNQISPVPTKKIGNAPEVNFTMFISVFTLFSMFFLGPASWKYFTDQTIFQVATLVDGLNFIFYFADGIALAAALQVHSCDNKVYTQGNRITQTSPNTKVRCQEAQAATAFVWVLMILFALTTVFSLSMTGDGLNLFGTEIRLPRRTHRDSRDNDRRADPDMEEVIGGPMVADDPVAPPRAFGNRRGEDSIERGWNTDDDQGSVDGRGSRGGRIWGGGRGRGRNAPNGDAVINVPVGDPAFADEIDYPEKRQ